LRYFNKILGIGVSVTLIFFAGALPAPALSQFLPLQPANLTATGERAFQDLSRCLNTKDSLDVFYLIDESKSLRTSDSTDSRAEILKSSLLQLNSLAESKQVNYAVGFFGDKYNSWQKWTSLNQNNINSLAEEFSVEVKKRKDGSGTNWKLGLESALQELNQQKSISDGCQILVFLTDGQIDVANPANDFDENAALNEICASNLDAGSVAFQNNRSIADEIRQSEIVHLGVLLKDPVSISEGEFTQLAEGRMRPILEGMGGVGGFTCGQSPIPKNFAAGALLVAEDPLALAFQFLKVGGLVSGGSAGELSATNPAQFEIEPGIASFRIITTSPTWTLTGPNGQNYEPTSNNIEVIESAGAFQITAPVSDSEIGIWNFKFISDSFNELFLYSGLNISLNEGELIAGSPGTISGVVTKEFNNQKPDLSLYGSAELIIQEVLADGSDGISNKTSISEDGVFNLSNFVPKEGQSRVNIRATLYLKTVSGQNLAPLSVSQTLDVRLPENFPSWSPTVANLGMLSGSKGKAIGEITAIGPQIGSGRICLDEKNINIASDSPSVDRNNTWIWNVEGVDSQGCVALDEGEQKRILISAQNEVTANSPKIVAQLPVTFFSDNEPSRTIDQTLEINFQSEKVVNEPVAIATLILLILLGIALPLLLLYLMNYLTTKISMGRQLQRASFDVLIDSDGKIMNASAGGDSSLSASMDDFKFLPEMKDTRNYDDGLVEIKAKVSKLALLGSWYEISPKTNISVFTMSPKPNRLASRFKDGSLAATESSLDKIWYLLINKNDMNISDTTNKTKARLVVFMRSKPNESNPYSLRINQIITTPGFATAFAAFKKDVESNSTEKTAKNNKSDLQKSNRISTNQTDKSTATQFPPSPSDNPPKIPPPPPGSAIPPPPPPF
jgi:Mg-chelatase subunit ChlD